MGLFSFFEGLFCGKYKTQVAELKEEKRLLIIDYQNLAVEKLNLVVNCNKDKLLLHEKIKELEAAIEGLEEAGETSFNYPIVEDYDEVPYDVSKIGEFYDVEFVRADAKYNLFSKQEWVDMLDVIHPLVKEALVSWKRDISDCDNWSMVSSALISIAFKKSGYLMQGAYAMAHTIQDADSRHAYNLFVDTDHKVWLYEPQNNTIIGQIADGVGVYNTGFVWFLA